MKPLLTVLLLITLGCANIQRNAITHNFSIINSAKWLIPRSDTLDYEFGEYLGKQALLLKRKIGNYKSASVAYPKDLIFSDGTVEMDIAWPGKNGGYVGLAFRIQDEHHYETVYFRTESSGTINAIQYMPEKKVEFNWWNYEDNKYQATATLPTHGWFHIKAIVKGNNVTVYINGSTTPALVYNRLDSGIKSGSVGFWLGNSSVGAYKNLIVTSM